MCLLKIASTECRTFIVMLLTLKLIKTQLKINILE